MPRTRSQAGSSVSEQSGEPADQLRRAQEVYATFELFKPNRWLTATDGVAGIQMINFNRLREFCSSVISRDTSIYDNFVHMKDRWDDSLLALIRTFQHAAAALNKYRAGKMDAESCANALQHITGKIRNNRHNSPLELEPDQRNPHLATEIVLFILDEVLEAALMKRLAAEEQQVELQPEALYGLLIGRYAAQQSTPELYRDLLNLPSHFLPRHEARMRRVIDKQRRMSDQYINENILTTLRSKIPTSDMAGVGGSAQGEAASDESEDYEDDSDDDNKEEEDSDDDDEEEEEEGDDDEEMEYSAEE